MRYFLIGVAIFWCVTVSLILYEDHHNALQHSDGTSASRVEVVFWHAMGGPLGRVMDDLINRYNNGQQKYFVKSVGMGSYDTLAKKLLASLVADEAPDISQNYETLTKKFIKHRKIVCLEELIASESEDIKSDIIPVLLANNTFDGKLYSFPFNKSVPVLYYNKDIFRKTGLDPEHPPETLTELASYARHITNYFRDESGNPTIYGYGTSKGNIWMFQNRILQFGGTILSEDARESALNEPPAVQALGFLLDMLREKIAYEGQGFDHQNDFKAEHTAMIDGSIVSKVYMESTIEFDFGVAPLPGQTKKGVILSGSNINIFNNGDQQKIAGAWDFIKWFTSTEIGAEWSLRTTYLPIRISSLQSRKFTEAFEKDPNIRAPYIQLDYCHFEPRLDVWFEIRDLMADYLERASIELGDPETYLNKLNTDVDSILRYARD